MRHALQPYPAYKPAGVPWLQQVPEHWELLRTKNFLREENVRSKTGKEDLLSVSQYTGITKRKDSLRGGSGLVTTAKTLVGYKLVEPGDLVMNIMLAWRGSQAVSPIAGITSPAYSVFRVTSDQVVPQYLHYIYRTEIYNGLFKTVSTGVMDSRLRLYPEVFFRLPTLLPPPDEQHLIVRYLHALDAKVKRYIRTKRKLISALQEQKQAIIQRAVTRGLDPNVKLKPSGVEWLGEVPEHWEVKRLSQFGQFLKGRGLSRADITESGVPAILYGDIYTTYDIETDSLRKFTSIEAACKAEALRSGDLLFTGSGETRADIGKSLTYTGAEVGYAGGDLIILRQQLANSSYLSYFLNSKIAVDQKVLMARGDIIVHIYASSLRRLMVAVPPRDEQASIAQYLRAKCEHIKKDIEHINASISRMTEYHTRLIADVVTGAVDVTAVAKAMAVETESAFARATTDEEEPLSMAAEGSPSPYGYGDEEEAEYASDTDL